MPRGKHLLDSDEVESALCAQIGIEAFFVEGGDDHFHRTKQAKEVCEKCPLMEACLYEALTVEWGDSRYARAGIYGGLTNVERWKVERDKPLTSYSLQRARENAERVVARVRLEQEPMEESA